MNALELRLPSLSDGDPETQLRQLRSYLYQLTEQLQFALGSRETAAAAPDVKKLVNEAAALSIKRGDGRYAGLEALEGPWRQQAGAIEALEARLTQLESRHTPQSRDELCLADGLGVQFQKDGAVCFTPLPPLIRTADGHWQIQ